MIGRSEICLICDGSDGEADSPQSGPGCLRGEPIGVEQYVKAGFASLPGGCLNIEKTLES
jgi:hypothetical protein